MMAKDVRAVATWESIIEELRAEVRALREALEHARWCRHWAEGPDPRSCDECRAALDALDAARRQG